MDFITAVKTCFEKYVVFSGRARRSEYWWWVLFTSLAGLILGVIDGIVFGNGQGVFGGLFSLATLLPGIAVGVRRLHDVNRSGWWLLLALIPIVGWIIFIIWVIEKGTAGDNRFGPDPLAPQMIG